MNRIPILLLLAIISMLGCMNGDDPQLSKNSSGKTLGDHAVESVLPQPIAATETRLPSPAELLEILEPEPAAKSAPVVAPVAAAVVVEKEVKSKRAPIYDEKADAQALIAAAVERAQMEHKNVLIEWGGNWCGWCFRLHDVFIHDDTVSPIVNEEFVLVLIDSNSNQELMQSYGGKERSYSYPHLTILDTAGKVLTNQETGSLEEGNKHEPGKVSGFLNKWRPEQIDAETQLTAALTQAKAEDKSVLLQVGTPYCGWCKVLSRFLHEHKDLFSQDYVLLKIDTLRMRHGSEVAARFQPAGSLGVPWVVILDPQGKVLVSSVNPAGNNIGYPSAASEIDHFQTMLKDTRKRLTDTDLETIRNALNAAREEREARTKRQASDQ